MNPKTRAAVDGLFAGQHAVAARSQLLATGLAPSEYRRLVVDGTWVEVCQGVVAVAGAPASWLRAPTAAVLASPKVAIARATALALQGLDGFPRADDLQLIAPRGTKPVMPSGATLTTG